MKNELVIGFESHIYLLGNDGPKAFMKRLKSSIKRQGLAKIRNSIHPFYDIGLFKNTRKNIYRKPYVLRADGIYYDIKETLGPNNTLNRPIFRSIDQAAGIVYVSAFSKRLIENFYRSVHKPSTVIHNAVDTDLFKPEGDNMRQRIGIPPEDRVLVTSAHWRKWKRLEDMISVFLEHLQGGGGFCHLLVLGGDPDYVVEHERIHYIGEVNAEDLPAWYRTGDVYVHLAWLENCGNTQIEAMACGLPVLCTNEGGIGETVIKADGGIVSQADQPFHFQPVDLYDPPTPDYEVILRDLDLLLGRLDEYRARIKAEAVGIDRAAREYCRFLSEVCLRTRAGSLDDAVT